jgi:hypothetical protein
MRLTIIAAVALLAVARLSPELAPGHYQGALTTRSNRRFDGPSIPSRQLAGEAVYTNCGDLLGLSFKDTITAGLSMFFMARVSTIRLGAYRARSGVRDGWTPALPAPGDTTLSGFFTLLIGHDWGFFPDSGSLHLTRITRNEIVGSLYYVARSVPTVVSQPRVTVTGSFRAVKDTASCS